jgi:hypothetical protein
MQYVWRVRLRGNTLSRISDDTSHLAALIACPQSISSLGLTVAPSQYCNQSSGSILMIEAARLLPIQIVTGEVRSSTNTRRMLP